MTNSARKSHGVAVALLFAWLAFAAPAGAQEHCVGDCQGSGTVQINELILCVSISLESLPSSRCSSCDANGNGVVAINELILAVNASLYGCPNGSTPTPQATDTPGGPTSTATSTPIATVPEATATPAADIENVTGATAAIANAVASIPNILGALLAGISATQSAQSALSGIPGGGAGNVNPCELGGTVTEANGLPNLSLVFDDCRVSRPGGSLLFDGTLNVTITDVIPPLGGTASFQADITFFNDEAQVLTTTRAALSSPIAIAVAGAPGAPCTIEVSFLGDLRITRLDLNRLTGTLDSEVTAQGTSNVTWDETRVSIMVGALSADCVPIEFDVSVNGDAIMGYGSPGQEEGIVSGGAYGAVFDALFEDFVISATGDGNASEVDISGKLTSSCLGETVTLTTPMSLSFLLGKFCPSGGTMRVRDIGDIVYSPAGVEVNGMSFASCVDRELLQCP